MSSPVDRRGSQVRALPAGVWAMGIASLFMDTSSELIHSLLPVFMVSGGALLLANLIAGALWSAFGATATFAAGAAFAAVAAAGVAAHRTAAPKEISS